MHDQATVTRTAGHARWGSGSDRKCHLHAVQRHRLLRHRAGDRSEQAARRGRRGDVGDVHDAAAGGSFSYLAHYNGDANYPAKDAGCEPFTDPETPQGQITPTRRVHRHPQRYVLDARSDQLHRLWRQDRQSINPGVFFFWTKITTTSPNQVVTVTQTNTSTNNAALFRHRDWVAVHRQLRFVGRGTGPAPRARRSRSRAGHLHHRDQVRPSRSRARRLLSRRHHVHLHDLARRQTSASVLLVKG